MENFQIIKDITKKIRRFGLHGRTLQFKIKPAPANEEPVRWIKNAINQIVEKGIEGLKPTDKVGFTFCSKEFNRSEGWMSFKDASNVTFDDVWKIISSVYQSNSKGLSTETFCLGITTVQMPAGKGNHNKNYNNFHEECVARRGIVVINNKDNLCLPRALVLALAYVGKDLDYQRVRKDVGKLQSNRAKELCTAAGVIIPNEGAGIPELEKFQKHLKDNKIVVYRYGSKGRDVIFEGSGDGVKLNLLYHANHYNIITSLTAAFACSYFCEQCRAPFNNQKDHRCGGSCAACQQTPACVSKQKIRCCECNRTFRGQKCFDNHKVNGSYGKTTVCATVKRCSECLKTVNGYREHSCGEVFCKICNKHQPSSHYCFMQCDNEQPRLEGILYIFYDLETRQEKQFENGSLLHEPNLCCFKQCCDECINTNNEICVKCGVRLQKL